MLILNNIFLPLDFGERELYCEAAKQLKIDKKQLRMVSLYRRSVDARKKDNIRFCCSLLVSLYKDEERALKRCKNASVFGEEKYSPPVCHVPKKRPLVVGFGPAGMFAALTLARAGARPIVIERGEPVEKRTETVNAFMSGKALNPDSNVQFGEGGAGTFSDGKLNTGIKNIRCRAVLEDFAKFGADGKILVDAKPHIGTDKLINIVKNIRKEIFRLGGEVIFSCRLERLITKNGAVCGAEVSLLGERKTIECDSVVLALGHSARDTIERLVSDGIKAERKPFSVGARIEHLRADIDTALYGDFAGCDALGAADYKLAVHLENGRGVYTFCMCPGGEVINASSEEDATAVNGMSLSARNGINSNSALLTDVKPEDLVGDDVLAGMYLQREIEKAAYAIGGGKVPIQTVGSLFGGENRLGRIMPSVKPDYVLSNLDKVFPPFVKESLMQGIRAFGRKISGFDCDDAVLTFPETRSSSPVRFLRNEQGESESLCGLYPCGEGAGYAGGIMSAAVDGIKTAEHIIEKINTEKTH